jgi:beta-lactamase class A
MINDKGQAIIKAFAPPELVRAVQEAVTDFANAESGRSVALVALRGPNVQVTVNEEYPRPAASLLKVPLVVAVYEQARSGRQSLDDPVPRKRLGATAYSSILEAFSADHVFSIKELCSLALITSDNPITEYLLELVGLNAVNRAIQRLGARHTVMRVGFGDADVANERGRLNVTTAADALTMMTRMAEDSFYEPLIHALKNNLRNIRIPLRLPDTLPIAHKTGSLEGAANDMGIVYGCQVDLAVAFLCDGQADTARTSLAIGDCMAAVWDAWGEQVE